MFDLREFLMLGFRDAVGKQADFKVVENAAGWYEKNVLTDADLAEIQRLIAEKNTPAADLTETVDEVTNTEEGDYDSGVVY